MKISSNRGYLVIGISEGKCYHNKLTLEEIISNRSDFEYIYALQEILDNILDLRVGESIYIYLDRDDENSKGVIMRIR